MGEGSRKDGMGKGDYWKGSTNFRRRNLMEVWGLGPGKEEQGVEEIGAPVERMQAVEAYKTWGSGGLENHGKRWWM